MASISYLLYNNFNIIVNYKCSDKKINYICFKATSQFTKYILHSLQVGRICQEKLKLTHCLKNNNK